MFDGLFKAWEQRRNNAKKKYWYNQKSNFAREYVHQHSVPELTIEEKIRIDEYWAQYGIKFRDYSWFRCFGDIYEGGVNPRFIPNEVYAYIIWPYYDNPFYVAPWKDKNFFERFLPDVSFPKTIVRRVNGRYEDYTGCFLDRCNVKNAFNYPERVIVKDAWDSGEGRGVKKYTLNSESDTEALLKEWEDSHNYLIQETISQHPVFAQFNASSVNILRISSWRHDDKVEILSPTIRFGTPGFITDTCFINGVETGHVVGISESGRVKDSVVSYSGETSSIYSLIESETPDLIIPKFAEIIGIIKKAHLSLQLFDIIGWDFTVSNKGEIICIEYNIKRPGTVFYQFVNGPFFGEHTDDVLSFLKDVNNQDAFIPKWLKK